MTQLKKAMAGDTITEHVEAMYATLIDMGANDDRVVTSSFNDVPLIMTDGDTVDGVVKGYFEECERRSEEYRRSPAYAKVQKEAAEREVRRCLRRDTVLRASPDHPTWSDPAGWSAAVKNNQDGYGGAVISFAERWARAMEGALANGTLLEECAKSLAHDCDDEKISGFMYGCAVGILSKCWVHGEDLRRWHNHETQIGTEGDEANESGGVLNPALLSFR